MIKKLHKRNKWILLLAALFTVQAICLCCVSVAYAGSASALSKPDVTVKADAVQNNSPADWFSEKVYNATHTRSRWLYDLMSASGEEPSVSPGDGQAVFSLAKQRGIISSYSAGEPYQPVDRRFVAKTLVKALGYKNRVLGYLADVTAADRDLATVSYYGWFLPDINYKLFPEAEITPAEYDSLLEELSRCKLLRGKRVLSFGDSIMFGAGNSGEGVSDMIADKYGMICFDFAVSGASMGRCDGRGHIADQVRKAVSEKRQADVILLNGGTNDVNHTKLGELNSGFNMSDIKEDTFTDGFEKTMWLITNNWKNVPVIYIRAHNMDIGSDAREELVGERGVAVAGKWKAGIADLYTDSLMNTEDPLTRNRYTYLEPATHCCDSVHPTAVGYAKFYLPPVSRLLTDIFTDEV